MSTHKQVEKLCLIIFAAAILLTILFVNGERLGLEKVESTEILAYEEKLFDTSSVHRINIVMDDWDSFLETCTSEEYHNCTVEIDDEAYQNVAIRAKGNTSLTQVAAYGNDRYSFKIEFDHYDSGTTYYGLDKLCLNNLIQDNTCMKDYLTYQMMGAMGVASPLCSYVYVTVNGEDWGLYLAVEAVEESFLQRNYGSDYGALFKPDSSDIGGGRGNGAKFDMDEFVEGEAPEHPEDMEGGKQLQKPEDMEGGKQLQKPEDMEDGKQLQKPEDMEGGKQLQKPEDMEEGQQLQRPEDMEDDKQSQIPGGMNSADVLLQYIDDDSDSYANIFDNAKTKVSEQDKKRLIQALQNLSEEQNLAETVDIESVISYFVVHNFVLNFDSYTGSMIHNYYLYEKEGQLQMIPWDYNLAFGGFQSMEDAQTLINYPIDDPVSGSAVEERPMLAWIFSNTAYTEQYHDCFSTFISSYFESGYFETMVDEVEAMIRPYVEKDPTKFCTYEEFEAGVSTLKEFCLLRAESIRGQLNGTIGTTAESQNADSLIGANDLQISDMGSMNPR